MAELVRRGPSVDLPGIGRVRQGAIQGVPDDRVDELLATGEWQRVTVTEPERVTEPAPATKRAGAPAARKRGSTARKK